MADLAVAAAELDGHPLAGQPEFLRQSAVEVVQRHPGAAPEDVLLWAEARASAAVTVLTSDPRNMRVAEGKHVEVVAL